MKHCNFKNVIISLFGPSSQDNYLLYFIEYLYRIFHQLEADTIKNLSYYNSTFQLTCCQFLLKPLQRFS